MKKQTDKATSSEPLQIIRSLAIGNSPALNMEKRLNQIAIQAEKAIREHAARAALAEAAEKLNRTVPLSFQSGTGNYFAYEQFAEALANLAAVREGK